MQRRSRVLMVVGVAAAVAAVAWVVAWPAFRPSIVASRLASPDREVRARAIAGWSHPAGAPRLFEDEAVMQALAMELGAATPAPVLDDLVAAFGGSDTWVDRFGAAHLRYLAWLLGSDPGAGQIVLTELDRWSPGSLPEGGYALLQRVSGSADREVRERAVLASARHGGTAGELIVAGAREDPDPGVARTAWLALGFMDPAGGYSGDWSTAPGGVADALAGSSAAT